MSSASRSLLVLEYLATVASASHGELASTLGISKSTLSDLLAELRELNVIQPVGTRHALGPRALALAHRIRRSEPAPALRDLLEAVRDATGETTFFSVETGGTERVAGAILPVECVESEQDVRVSAIVGSPRPMLETAAGRLLLALTGRRAAAQPRRTANGWAPASPATAHLRHDAEVDADLGRIAAQGYCVQEREEDHIVSVAVPLYLGARHPVGTVSISGPAFRMADPRAAAATMLEEIARHADVATPEAVLR